MLNQFSAAFPALHPGFSYARSAHTITVTEMISEA